MLELTIIGNIGQDAQIKEANGRKFISFSVGENQSYKDKDGVKHETTTWVSCLKPLFNEQSNLASWLKAGTQVWVRGRASTKVYTTKDGATKCSLNCLVDDLSMLSSQKRAANEVSQPAPTTTPSQGENAPQTAQNIQKVQVQQAINNMQNVGFMPVEDELPF